MASWNVPRELKPRCAINFVARKVTPKLLKQWKYNRGIYGVSHPWVLGVQVLISKKRCTYVVYLHSGKIALWSLQTFPLSQIQRLSGKYWLRTVRVPPTPAKAVRPSQSSFSTSTRWCANFSPPRGHLDGELAGTLCWVLTLVLLIGAFLPGSQRMLARLAPARLETGSSTTAR